MTDTVVATQGLGKKYGSLWAVRDLSFSVQKGQVFGILGPNGSGKTTTLAMLAGVVNASTGSFQWFDKSPEAAQRRQLGIILEKPNFYPYMSAYNNLKLVAAIKQISDKHRIDKVLQRTGLYERRHHKFKTYSLGMKQRLAIASALLSDPEVLVLDEPTNGLDPQGIAEIRQLISEISNEGKTILLASHLLDEVQKVCSHYMVLQKGKLMYSGSVSEVQQGEAKIEVACEDMDKLKAALKDAVFVKEIKSMPDMLELRMDEGSHAAELNEWLMQRGIVLSHLVLKKMSLEQKFLQILAEG